MVNTWTDQLLPDRRNPRALRPAPGLDRSSSRCDRSPTPARSFASWSAASSCSQPTASARPRPPSPASLPPIRPKPRRRIDSCYDQGRYVEPIIRHVAKTTNDAQVKVLCRRLLLTDFVTDSAPAIHNAGDGQASMPTRPASCPARAAAPPDRTSRLGPRRGHSALEALKTYPSPPNQRSMTRSPATEIKAAALEATGR